MAEQTPITLDGLEEGTEVLRTSIAITRDALVRYAGASGDFNPIHYNDAAAQRAGLPGVLAHGMLTMGMAIAPVLHRLSPDLEVRSYTTRFTNPIVVPALETVELEVVAVVGTLDDAAGSARLDLTATVDGQSVLGRARAVIARSAGTEHPAEQASA